MSTESIGREIKRKRQGLKLTQEALGNKLCVSKTAVYKWEKGINYPDRETMPKLIEILGISQSKAFQFISNHPEEEKMNTIPALTSIQTKDAYYDLCDHILQDFKSQHPDYREPILYMVHEAILFAIGDTIYNYYGKKDECDYETVGCRIADCFAFDNPDREGRFVSCLDYTLYQTGAELFEDFPDPGVTDVDAFYNGKTGIGQAANQSGYNVLNFIMKPNNYGGHDQKEVKDNSFISEFEVALMQLEDLFASYC